MGRREELGDAAIAVVASAGLKGLTHRAVDATADVPAGTTSNYFRTRQALVAAVAERIEARDHEIWGGLGPAPATFEEFTDWLGTFAVVMAVDHAELERHEHVGERDGRDIRAEGLPRFDVHLKLGDAQLQPLQVCRAQHLA